MPEGDNPARFEQAILPHLDAAYNLARWLMRNDHDAQDVVQDACVRALRFFAGFRGGDSRVWLLAIVRNVCYSRLAMGRAREPAASFDEEVHADGGGDIENPENLLMRARDEQALRQAIENLPADYRETLVLRELEGLAYRQIAEVLALPIGTVMSRLARARKLLMAELRGVIRKGGVA